jgi:ribonuclease P protein component
MKENGFPKSERLLKRRDFQALSRYSWKVHTEHFIIICGGINSESSRIGITVSRKVGNAVTRNRAKRMIREFYRLNKTLFSLYDYNIIAKPGVDLLVYSELVRELTMGLKLLGKKKCPSN